MARKFYVVWSGRKTGVFTDWPMTQRSIDRFPGARFKSFASQAEAERAFQAGKPASAGRRPPVARARTTAPAEVDSATAGLRIYCDGACDPNPGRAGSGIAVYRDRLLVELWYGLYNPNGTNNSAELNALYHALLMAEAAAAAGETAQIFCDSRYSINCVSTWAAGWEKNGWRKPGGPIKNLSVIQAAHGIYARIEPRLQLTHVSAHMGTEGNELADRMAMFAVQSGCADLRRWDEEIDIQAILRMRAG